MGETKRPTMTLENEITNFFGHIRKRDNPEEMKRMPWLVKVMMEEITRLYHVKGQIAAIEKINPQDESIVKLKKEAEEREEKIRKYYFVEEIEAT